MGFLSIGRITAAFKVAMIIPFLLLALPCSASSENPRTDNAREWHRIIASVYDLEPNERNGVIIGVLGYFRDAKRNWSSELDNWTAKAVGYCAIAKLARETNSKHWLEYLESECLWTTRFVDGEISSDDFARKYLDNLSLHGELGHQIDIDDTFKQMKRHRKIIDQIGEYISKDALQKASEQVQ